MQPAGRLAFRVPVPRPGPAAGAPTRTRSFDRATQPEYRLSPRNSIKSHTSVEEATCSDADGHTIHLTPLMAGRFCKHRNALHRIRFRLLFQSSAERDGPLAALHPRQEKWPFQLKISTVDAGQEAEEWPGAKSHEKCATSRVRTGKCPSASGRFCPRVGQLLSATSNLPNEASEKRRKKLEKVQRDREAQERAPSGQRVGAL